MNNITFIYSLFLTAVVLMIIVLVLTWKSAFPRSTKWTLTVLSVITPWMGLILYLIFSYQYRVRQKGALPGNPG